MDTLFRCSSYSTAVSYQVKEIATALANSHTISWFRDVLYVDFSTDKASDGGAFIFSYGVVVFWGLSQQKEQEIIETLRHHEQEHYEVVETETLQYLYGDQNSVAKDLITLASSNLDNKVAFSHGLAQSAKLCVFESTVKNTINSTREIPKHLSQYGKIPLSRWEIRKKMGTLFIDRSSINLHFDVLDVPEYFWEHYELEPLYNRIATYLDLDSRVEILNQRLDIIHDLFEMLSNELNHQHSSFLEWIIILLIAIEVIASFVR